MKDDTATPADHRPIRDSGHDRQRDKESGEGPQYHIARPARNKKRIIWGAIIVVAILLVGWLLYAYVIPRTEAELVVVYRENIGSAVINVNAKLINRGTSELEDVTVEVWVLNATNAQQQTFTIARGTLAAREEVEEGSYFNGTHFEPYTIIVQVSGNTDQERISFKESFTIGEEHPMFIEFRRTIN